MVRACIIFLILLLIFTPSCSNKQNELDCSNLKNGKFYYKSVISAAGSKIERNDSIQIVINEKSGKKETERIKWLGPCVYEVLPYSNIMDDSTGDELLSAKVTILSVSKEYYTFNVSNMLNKTGYNDTMWIVYLVGGFNPIGETLQVDN